MIKLFEQFNNEQEIINICKEYNIENYSINPDGSIDVDGNVNLTMFKLRELPLKFNKVNGWFSCSNNLLTTLKGCPKEIYGDFIFSNNLLTSIDYCPNIIEGSFKCDNNNLTSLEGGPMEVNGNLYCGYNNLTSLKGFPLSIVGNLHLYNNPISIIDESIDVVGSIYIKYTKFDDRIGELELQQNKLRILFEHGVDYVIFKKDGSVNDSRLERLFKDFNI